MKIYYLTLALLLSIILSSCASTTTTTRLNVFAAASLTEAFTDIATQFEAAYPKTDVVLNFAGSQTLRLQIEQGAQVDLFASANEDHMQVLVEANLLQDPTIFTQNRLAVIVPMKNPAGIDTLADLAQPNIKLVLAGPNVPVGHYARASLERLNQDPRLGADYASKVLSNVVSEEENVKAVVAKVLLGEADAGVVYLSDVTAAAQDKIITLIIPPNFNIEANYPIAVAADSQASELTQQFVDFVLSSTGQDVLAHHGLRFGFDQAIGQEQ